MDTLYREEILEHYREPMNFGKLGQFDVSSKQVNLLCGDEIAIYLQFNNRNRRCSAGAIEKHPKGVIREIGFEGRGCAISMAAASMLTESVKGKTKEQLTKFSQEDMLKLLGITVSETRKKCALLALAVLKDCLESACQEKKYALQSKS